MPKKEEWHQVKFMGECALLAYAGDIRYSKIHSIPNGGLRSKITAARMVAEGARKGVPDIFVPVACHGCHGMYIEFKREIGGVVSKDQKKWKGWLEDEGFAVVVVYTYEEALTTLSMYFGESSGS